MAAIEDVKLTSTIDLVSEAFDEHIISVLKSRSAYGDSWKHLRVIYCTNRILSKARRINNIENLLLLGKDSNGDIEEELRDIISYALFALIKISWIEFSKSSVDWVLSYFGAIGDQNG